MHADVEADAADASYRWAVDRQLREASETDRPWPELLRAAGGVDPRLVAHRVRALNLPVRPWEPSRTPMPSEDAWDPELHALDFEWYFEPACAAALAERVVTHGPRTLCLGTPTVAFALLRHPACERVTLIDENPLAARRHPESPRLRTIVEDLAAARVEVGGYDAVIFDAPWYPDELLRWLAFAVASVRPGGGVLFALPQPLHRPSAVADRRRVLEAARELGTVHVEPATLHYETPRFEREALATAGVGVPASWRRADLAELVRRRPHVPRPTPQPTPRSRRSRWSRFVVGSQVIRLDPGAPDRLGDPLSPLPGAVDYRYGSISTRDPQRSAIGLWTSRSRVARVRRPALLARALERLTHEPDLGSLRENPVLRRLDAGSRARLLDSLAAIVGHE